MSIDKFENGHEYLISRLQKLKKISAPENFESVIMSKINSRQKKISETKRKTISGIIPVSIIIASFALILIYNQQFNLKNPAKAKSQLLENSKLHTSSSLKKNNLPSIQTNDPPKVFNKGNGLQEIPSGNQSLKSLNKNQDSMLSKAKINSGADKSPLLSKKLKKRKNY